MQVDPIKPKLKAPGIKLLRLKHDRPLSHFAFKFNLRCYIKVMHAKLLYDATRPDADGKPRSRGLGFVEFEEHEHALTALRALNNHPDAFGTPGQGAAHIRA